MSALVEVVPTLPALADQRTGVRALDFFTAQIRNPNAREAYVRFAVWGASAGIGGGLLAALFATSITRVGAFHEDPMTMFLVSVAGLVNSAAH